MVEKSACNPGDPGSIPGSGRSPGEGNGYPLQYSCLEKAMDRGAWRATVHGVAKSWTRRKRLSTHVSVKKAKHPLKLREYIYTHILRCILYLIICIYEPFEIYLYINIYRYTDLYKYLLQKVELTCIRIYTFIYIYRC